MDVPKNIRDAKKVQLELKKKLKIRPLDKLPIYIAGVDASFTENRIIAAACLYKLPDLVCNEHADSIETVSFPYVPGYLSFREGPAIIHAIRKLSIMPDLILFDGQGIAHPRRLGLAAHLGLFFDRPTNVCARSKYSTDCLGLPARRVSLVF